MRIPSYPNIISLSVGLLVATLAVPAAAGSFYRYQTDDGAIAFTDDAKRVPERYQDSAEVIQRNGFDDFDRYTEVGPSHEAAFAGRTNARIEHLRELNARTVSPDAVTAPSALAPGSLALRTSRDVQTFMSPQGNEPVIVETVRSRPDGSPVTRHITIVRQGDRILSVVAPQQHHSTTRSLDERTIFE
jgi:hypothetical protein